jgi:hypothetical protein
MHFGGTQLRFIIRAPSLAVSYPYVFTYTGPDSGVCPIEWLDWQPSQFINIVGKDDFIQAEFYSEPEFLNV